MINRPPQGGMLSGAKGNSPAAEVTSVAVDADTQALDVVVANVDVLSTPPASDTGQAALAVRVISQLGAAGGSQSVSGTVTANIGTSGSLALDTSVAKLTVAQGAALGSNTNVLVGGSVTTGAPTYTPGNINPLSLTTAGALRVDGSGATQPVSGPLTDTQLRAAALPVSGTITANAGSGTMAVSGPLTDAQLRAAAVPVSGTFWQTTQPVSGTVTANAGTGTMAVSGPLTDAELRASAVPVSGTFWQTIQPVSGTVTANAGSGTMAVSGPLTDAQVRATPLPVSLTSTTVTGTVAVTGPLTDTQLRAAAVPVSGTVTANGPLTDAQLRAAVVPVSLASTTVTGSVAVTGPLTDAQIRATPLPVSGTVALGTGTAAVGSVITNHGKTIKSAAISASASGDNTVVPAVVGKRIKVLGFSMQSVGSVNAKWKDGAGTDLTGAYVFAAREGVSVFTANPGFALGTSAGNALVLNLSASSSMVGFVTYFDDDAS